MEEFKRIIHVYENHFWDFYYAQTPKVQDRIDWVIGLVRSLIIVPKKYFDHLSGTDGLFEIRVQVGNNIFRVFCFFDEGNLVILLSGFQKKTQKTPRSEIKKATRLKQEYYDRKGKN
ncbi:MAG: type II toxin-antitoxin system RelE/ParE family toxin [Bacteroidales bacterium]|nr:type II toxin-antitoxin system RelE/ParE family toxin [Bacteroidales bacterium]